MPYRPNIIEQVYPTKSHIRIVWGPTCLAGDIIGDYSFDAPLKKETSWSSAMATIPGKTIHLME